MTEFNDTMVLEELNISNVCVDESDKYFAQVIGCIEEVIMDEDFTNLQSKFMEDHWKEFENEDENKLIYTEIFKKYIATIERFIEEQLLKSIKDFNMRTFEKELERRQNELDGEIFEILFTFSDFSAFKTMFLDYKAMKEGKILDFSKDVSISKYYLAV